MVGRTCVVTGATSGLGRATALMLAERGADVVLVGRNQQLGERVARLCRRRNPRGRARFMRADLASQADVRGLAAVLVADIERLDVLINNAGARYDTYAESPEGIERTFAGNHLGHFLLTHLLLQRLAAAAPGRVITIGSQAHHGADLAHGWLQSREHYDRRIAYANSKLANIVFARELAARVDKAQVVSNAVDPGILITRFAQNNGLISWLKHLVAHAIRRELMFPSSEAETVVRLASADTATDVTGRYFRRREESPASPLANDPEVGRGLWELSRTLTAAAGC